MTDIPLMLTTTTTPAAKSSIRSLRLLALPEFTAFAVIAITLVILLVGSPYFLDGNNLDSLQTSVAPTIIVAIGMTVLFVTGTFDLSVGATMGLAGLAAAYILSQGMPMEVAICSGIAIGAAVGLLNGLLVSFAGLNPLIVTLGTMYMLRGLIDIWIGGGRPQPWMYVTGPEVDGQFFGLGSLKIFGVYLVVWIALALVVIVDTTFRRRPVGRALFFAGGNPAAARSLGFPVRTLQLGGFVLCGVLAAIAGMFITARTGLSSRYAGSGVELQIIIACLIGGASIAGGRGSIIGSALGVVFITLVNNAFNLFEVAAEWQKVVVGGVLVAVVVSDAWRLLRRKKRMKRD
jgi:ribose transport system permease protein